MFNATQSVQVRQDATVKAGKGEKPHPRAGQAGHVVNLEHEGQVGVKFDSDNASEAVNVTDLKAL